MAFMYLCAKYLIHDSSTWLILWYCITCILISQLLNQLLTIRKILIFLIIDVFLVKFHLVELRVSCIMHPCFSYLMSSVLLICVFQHLSHNYCMGIIFILLSLLLVFFLVHFHLANNSILILYFPVFLLTLFHSRIVINLTKSIHLFIEVLHFIFLLLL